jgi:hypothetical protein
VATMSQRLLDDSDKEAYYDDYRRQYERRWSLKISDEEHANLVSSDQTFPQHMKVLDFAEELSANKRQLEECICDLIGGFASAEVLARAPISLPGTLAGASLALHHLRLVQMIDRVVGGSWGGEIDALGDDPYAASMLRLSIFRHGARLTAQEQMGDQGREIGYLIHDEMVKANLRHTEFILDPFLFGIAELLEEGATIPVNEEDAWRARDGLLAHFL